MELYCNLFLEKIRNKIRGLMTKQKLFKLSIITLIIGIALIALDYFFFHFVTDSGITLSKGDTATEIMDGFYKRCESLKDGSWYDGWRAFCLEKKEFYESVISRALLKENEELNRQRYAHYLDCEAHLDVFRELFPTWNLTNEK